MAHEQRTASHDCSVAPFGLSDWWTSVMNPDFISSRLNFSQQAKGGGDFLKNEILLQL